MSRRAALALGTGGLALALGATIVAPPAPHLVWNASASVPVGLYRISPGAVVKRGDMVLARLPIGWRDFAARRHYLPANVPLVKRLAAGPGAEICALGQAIFIDGTPAATRLARDAKGRAMPRWHGCRRLSPRQYFLLIGDQSGSFDGRYFGISEDGDIIGAARLLWPR